jgi:branched-chain amino acid aminotransferase
MERIEITRTTAPKPRPADDSLQFGRSFTDHMFVMNYDHGKGWHTPRITPYQPFTLDPSSAVLHYGQSVFDGLKAFRGRDDVIRLFRAPNHAARLIRSCERLCIPAMDPAMVEHSFRSLVALDRDWAPRLPGTSLYLRPTVIASEAALGVHPSHSYLYFLIVSPVGAYYAEGINPVKILVSETQVRAVKGGLGDVKCSGNYAASLSAAEDAHRRGYTQVLWLDGVHHRYIDEVGTMNIMLRIGDEIITPPLSGTILAGVTRDSVLTLARDWGLRVSERPVTIDEVVEAAAAGTLQEMWGTGTAAVVSPVGELGYQGRPIVINGGKTGALTTRLYEAITAIQYGMAPDVHGWTQPVEASLSQAA